MPGSLELRKSLSSEYPDLEKEGVFRVELKYKAWGKSMNLFLYFRDLDTDETYKVCVFRGKDGKTYGPNDASIDFSDFGTFGYAYEIEVGVPKRSRTGKVKMLTAKRLFVETPEKRFYGLINSLELSDEISDDEMDYIDSIDYMDTGIFEYFNVYDDHENTPWSDYRSIKILDFGLYLSCKKGNMFEYIYVPYSNEYVKGLINKHKDKILNLAKKYNEEPCYED